LSSWGRSVPHLSAALRGYQPSSMLPSNHRRVSSRPRWAMLWTTRPGSPFCRRQSPESRVLNSQSPCRKPSNRKARGLLHSGQQSLILNAQLTPGASCFVIRS
jgi:hypothetical protein